MTPLIRSAPWQILRRNRILYPHVRGIATHVHEHHARQLSIIPTNVDRHSDLYSNNVAQMKALTDGLTALHKKIQDGGSARAREKHIARGKMLPRE